MPLSPDNSSVIEHQVTNPLAVPIFVNDAAVTVTILDNTSTEIPDEAWPVTLPFVSGSDGIYRKSFDPFNLVVGEIYTVIINVVGTDALESKCITKIKATERIC